MSFQIFQCFCLVHSDFSFQPSAVVGMLSFIYLLRSILYDLLTPGQNELVMQAVLS